MTLTCSNGTNTVVCPLYECVVGVKPPVPPLDDCPVSLKWSDEQFGASVSQFPLNPKYLNKWFIWRASAAQPLLVYDPAHTGEITSAEQLIGNYSFGKHWENGYLALASLDLNHDHQLTSHELDDLGLWFDSNRDGVSQSSEVKSLTDLKVVRIYFKNYQTDYLNGELNLKIGFKRVVRGNIISGESYDWASAGAYANKTDAERILRFMAEDPGNEGGIFR
ncbi:MAG: hypothetical protein SFT81_02955 [Candidatus Caenarcaniphilales bacterium]|nr:hypothetical protein [Candidatus Caenarcaniphilales bacterium]